MVTVTDKDRSEGEKGDTIYFTDQTRQLFRRMLAEFDRKKWQFKRDQQRQREEVEKENERRQIESERRAREEKERRREAERQAEIRRREEEERRRKEEQRNREEERLRIEENDRRLEAASKAWDAEPKLGRCESRKCPAGYPHGVLRCRRCGSAVVPVQVASWLTREEFLDLYTVVPTAAPVVPAADDETAVEQVAAELNFRADQADYAGVGNLILEGLLRPGQLGRPDGVSRLLAGNVRKVVALRFGIPEFLTYLMPLRDREIAAQYRGSWAEDMFHQAIIYAYVLGATWKTLPPHFDKIVDYYFLMANEQKDAIAQAATGYRPPDPPPPKKVEPSQAEAEGRAKLLALLTTHVIDLNEEIERVENSNYAPSLIVEEVARLKKEREGLTVQIQSLTSH